MKRTDLDLASRALGGSVRYVSDEFFAACEALLTPDPPVHDTKTFGPHGKIYDGWETRRRRTPGYDWAVVALGVPGVLHEIVVDTSFFLGNYPPEVSVEATWVDGSPDRAALDRAEWITVVPNSAARGNTPNTYRVYNNQAFTHVRLNIYPDGGVARLRVHGSRRSRPAGVGGPDRSGCHSSRRRHCRMLGHVLFRCPACPVSGHRQVDGRRLGNRAPAHRRQRLHGRHSRRPGPVVASSPSTPATSSAMRLAGCGSPPARPTTSRGTRFSPNGRSPRIPATDSGCRTTKRSPRSGSTSIPTADSPGCTCWDSSRRQALAAAISQWLLRLPAQASSRVLLDAGLGGIPVRELTDKQLLTLAW